LDAGLAVIRRKLAENLKRVEQRVRNACERAGRDPAGVTIVAITKYASLDVIRTMVDMGFSDLGENRVQELTKRAAAVNESLARRARDVSSGLKPRPRWHMVGHLQRNKVKALLPWVEMIHSVDSLRLAEEVDSQAAKLDRVIPVLLEVNAGDEPTKQGVAVAATTHLAEQIATLERIELRGLMAMAPFTDDESRIRYVFGRTRELFDEIVSKRLCGAQFRDLSLGMSSDFEYGIEAGATYLRIGSALFEGIALSPEATPADPKAAGVDGA
jgi:pyridoxal phosphate enzyme (YggS family)